MCSAHGREAKCIENLDFEERDFSERLRIILMRVPTVFVWLRVGSSDELGNMFIFHKMQEIS